MGTMNIKMQEFIGLKVMIAVSPDKSLIGLSGSVEDETKNMFHINTGERTIKVSKRNNTFVFTYHDGKEYTVKGDEIAFRAEDRIKRCRGR